MRSRLLALIVIPTSVGVMVGALQIVASIGRAGDYQRVLEKAELSAAISELTHRLALERDRAVFYVAAGRKRGREAALRAGFGPVDAAVVTVRLKAAPITPEHGDGAWYVTQQLLGRLPEIGAIRETVIGSQLLALPTLTKYSQITTTFEQFHVHISQGVEDETIGDGVRSLSALAKAKDAASRQRALLAGAASARRFQTGELDRFMASRAQQESEVAVFKSVATLDEAQLYDDTVTGTLVDRAESFRLRALAQDKEGAPLDIDPDGRGDADRWFAAMSGTVDGMRTVERRMTESITVRSRALQDAACRDALLAAVGSALLLLLVLYVTVVMARSLVGPLRRLRTEALRIAWERLPETVRALRESGDESALDVPPIGVDSRDEVGEVARAFDEVHREAVRLAGEESKLRANVNAMFVNLSRRSQALVERQIRLIDGLERGECDDRRLGDLFRLDHLATRMRRNSESLLVLAGQEPSRRWHRPVNLLDVARAAVSEVEDFERVVPFVADNASIAGEAVNDVVHLLAELIENALSFSPRDSRVTVSCSTIPGGSGVLLSVTDTGIGMTPEELERANERLADAPSVDVSVSRRMGLFVVARLAQRHGIRVRLRRHGPAGLTAMVFLPDRLLGPGEFRTSRDPTSTARPYPSTPETATPEHPRPPHPGHPEHP
ncbi:nitrate- and nitrite sensing domain-containing protein [Nonomuraea lactucae]|uniref:sensor histidine kinase n=1 Tax=Nonomuraea lactucae TaxID=2249762 RepID=UPI0013B417E5|nr:nitrate- and nitrite sensing domain-containing protein [Nonomuraea lactucae]